VPISGEAVVGWLRACAEAVAARQDHLNQLDAAIGDADHGANLHRGFQAVVGKLPGAPAADVGAVLKLVGMTLLSTVGGASGVLYGTFFLQLGSSSAGKDQLGGEEWAAALRAGVDGIARRGKATIGEKTMLDSLVPAAEALSAALAGGAPLEAALWRCERAAHQGMLATIPLVATKGRASYLGPRSAGHQDPGATSAHLLLRAAAATWAAGAEPGPAA
jgi:dihydroxyacetone kinase-like protein